MDIASLSTNLAQSGLAQAVGISVLKLAKESAAQQAQGLVKAIEQSVHPHLGGKLDIRV